MTRPAGLDRYYIDMRLPTLIVMLGLVLAITAPPGSSAAATDVELAQSGLLQCMTQCIKQEGEDEYETCKLRCANVPMDGGGQNQDCMDVYKDCKKACGNNNACRKECKGALMTCG